MPAPKKKKGGGGKKKKSLTSLPSPSPLQLLLSSHRATVPTLLSTFPHRADLLYLDLHLLTFPFLDPYTLLLTSHSTLLTLSHSLTQRHGPLASIRLFRSPHPHDELPFHPHTSLADLGCEGGRREEDRRYQLWYDVLSEVRGGVCMKEVRMLEEEGGGGEAEGGGGEWEEREMEGRGGRGGRHAGREAEATGEGSGDARETGDSVAEAVSRAMCAGEEGLVSDVDCSAVASPAVPVRSMREGMGEAKRAVQGDGAKLDDGVAESSSSVAAMWG